VEGREDLVRGADGLVRCWWAAGSTLLERYHDEEWGQGLRDERALFERLSLEAFQAGLSWRIVLERRPALRAALAGFDPEALAGLSGSAIDTILDRPEVIRNRAKVEAVLANARVLCELHGAGSGLLAITEQVLATHGTGERGRRTRPHRRSDVPAHTPTSRSLAQRLRTLGWRFVGPTTAYAYLQAAGWVDDHLVGCHVGPTEETPGIAPPLL
jgi:DNA-3-methyladenine glycosylase I